MLRPTDKYSSFSEITERGGGHTGYSSIGLPQTAPALFTSTFNLLSFLLRTETTRSTSSFFCMSAGMERQIPGPSAVSFVAVASQSLAERELM